MTGDGVDDVPDQTGRFYELLEYVGLRCQGKPIIQHLLQQLVDDKEQKLYSACLPSD